jgi:hypothetical protein
MSPLIALYLRLAAGLRPLRDRHTDTRTPNTCTLGSDAQQPRFLRWPLATGVYMFLSDNAPLWLLVLVLQPLLGVRYLHMSLLMVGAVGFLSCCLAASRTGSGSGSGSGTRTLIGTGGVKPLVALVENNKIAAEIRPSGGGEGESTVKVSTDKDEDSVRGPDTDSNPCEDLAGYVIAMTTTTILTLAWLAAQHYMLAMAVAVPLVPTLCAIVLCGSRLGVLPHSLPPSPALSPSPAPSLSAQIAESEPGPSNEALQHAMLSGTREETEQRPDASDGGQNKEQNSVEMGVIEMDSESELKATSTAVEAVLSPSSAFTHDVTSSGSLDLCPQVPAVNIVQTSPRSPLALGLPASSLLLSRSRSPSPSAAMKGVYQGALCIFVCALCPIGIPAALYSWTMTVTVATLPGHTSETFSTYFATLTVDWVCQEVRTATTPLLSCRRQRPHHTTSLMLCSVLYNPPILTSPYLISIPTAIPLMCQMASLSYPAMLLFPHMLSIACLRLLLAECAPLTGKIS